MPALLTGRIGWCVGEAEPLTAVYLELRGVARWVEQPFELVTSAGRRRPDFLSDDAPDRPTEATTPWNETTVWEALDTSPFAATTRAIKQQDRRRAQAEAGQLLASRSGCSFRMVVVELPNRPHAPEPMALEQLFGCKVEVISQQLADSLMRLRPYGVLLEGRDEWLLDDLVEALKRGPATLLDLAAVAGRPTSVVTRHALHAVLHGVLSLELEHPLDPRASVVSLTPQHRTRLLRLRRATTIQANDDVGPGEDWPT